MKNNILTMGMGIWLTCLAIALFAVKHLDLRDAYYKAEKEKVEYCRKYNEVECKYENLKDSLQQITNRYRQYK